MKPINLFRRITVLMALIFPPSMLLIYLLGYRKINILLSFSFGYAFMLGDYALLVENILGSKSKLNKVLGPMFVFRLLLIAFLFVIFSVFAQLNFFAIICGVSMVNLEFLVFSLLGEGRWKV